MSNLLDTVVMPSMRNCDYRKNWDFGRLAERVSKYSWNVILERVVNFTAALVLSVPAALILLPLYLLYILTEKKNGPFLFRAQRLGLHKQPFTMFKVRTMVNNAEKKIGGSWHKQDRSLEVWYGKFLRNTKIDELPQLLNVIRGEMTFVGPRPVRPADYDNLYKNLRNADFRFTVHPGLTGYSQFYTPGSVPRKFRIHIDNYFIRQNSNILHKFVFVAVTSVQFGRKIFSELFSTVSSAYAKTLYGRTKTCRRRYPRKQVNLDCVVSVDSGEASCAKVIDFSGNTLKIVVPKELGVAKHSDSVTIRFKHTVLKKRKFRSHSVSLTGSLRKQTNEVYSGSYLVDFKTQSDFDRYWLEKHVLNNAFAK